MKRNQFSVNFADFYCLAEPLLLPKRLAMLANQAETTVKTADAGHTATLTGWRGAGWRMTIADEK